MINLARLTVSLYLIIHLLRSLTRDGQANYNYDGYRYNYDQKNQASICVDLPSKIFQMLLGPTLNHIYLLRVVYVSLSYS